MKSGERVSWNFFFIFPNFVEFLIYLFFPEKGSAFACPTHTRMKRTWNEMATPVATKIEKLKSIMERAKLAHATGDYVQIPQLQRDYDDATGT